MPRPPSFKILKDSHDKWGRYRVNYGGKTHRFRSYQEAADAVAEWKALLAEPTTMREQHELAVARGLLCGTPLLTAVRFYLAHTKTRDPSMTVRQAVALHRAGFVAGRNKYQKEKERHLQWIEADFGVWRLSEVTYHMLAKYFAKIPSPWVHDTYLVHTRQFWRWCVKEEMVDENPAAKIAARNPKGSKVFLSLLDARRMLLEAREHFPQALTPLAFQMFAGIRTEELCRRTDPATGERPLDWRDVKLGRSISIEEGVAKTSERRVIDWWPPALNVWLPDIVPARGRIAKGYSTAKKRLVRHCRDKYPDFTWAQNALRHSYATYACAYFQGAQRVSLLMGHHDSHTIFRNYREYATEEEGRLYFDGLAEAELLRVVS